MSTKLYFSITFVFVLSLASATYGFTTHPDAFITVDFDHADDVNTHSNWVSFVLADSGSEVNDVNGDLSGVIIDIGGTPGSARRNDPNSNNDLGAEIMKEEMYRDFFYGAGNNPLDITIWGLGADRKVKIYIYAFDNDSTSRRVANWTGNGAELLTTDFEGGDPELWPIDPNLGFIFCYINYYDFNGIAYADDVGRIHLTSSEDPDNEDVPFAFANGLVIEPYGEPNAVYKAHRPVPFDGEEDASINPTFSWIPGDTATSHDVYLGTDPCALVFQGNVAPNSFTPSYFLKMNETYYWRVDEQPGTITGDVWSFTTANNYPVDDFEAYTGTNEGAHKLRDYWHDRFAGDNSTVSEVYTSALDQPALDAQSMRYRFRNDASPYYSEAWVFLADLGIDSNFAAMNVQSISIQFFGQELNEDEDPNPTSEPMYLALTDTSANKAMVVHPDPNTLTEEWWHEWNVSIAALLADNPSLDLTDIDKITIGFDPNAEEPYVEGHVFIDDIYLYTTRCVLSKRSGGLAKVDYAPAATGGDCIVDYQELEMMMDDWLVDFYSFPPPNNPGTDGLVAYYPFDDFNDANSVPGIDLPDGVMLTRNMAPTPHPNAVWAILSPIDPCEDPPIEGPVTIISPGIVIDDRPDGNCIHFEADEGDPGERVHCGRWPVVGNFEPGEPIYGWGENYKGTGDLTLSIWVKWAGPKIRPKSQGLISKRAAWDDDEMIWMFECDTISEPRGSFALRQKNSDYSLYSYAGILDSFIGQWIHLAATYHGTIEPDVNTAKLYLNGDEVISGPFYFSGGDPNAITMTIGNNSDIEEGWSAENFHGELDEVSIFNRALDANEIAYLADTDHSWPPPPPPPPTNLFQECFWCPIIINFRDFAVLANWWLVEEMWP